MEESTVKATGQETDPAVGTAQEGQAAAGDAAEAANQKAADPEQAPKAAASEAAGTGDGKAEPPADPEARLQEWEEQLKQREASQQRKELEAEAREYMKLQALPDTLISVALREDKESTMACIDMLKKELDAAVEARLNEKLTGRTPKATSGMVTAGDKTGAEIFAAALRG